MAKFKEVAVVGVGMTKFGILDKTQIELFSEAAMDAINESHLKPKAIQALFLGNVYGDFEEGQANIAPMCAAEVGMAGIPANRYEAACASSTIAMREAYMWVASGFYDIVMAAGTERTAIMGTPYATRTFALASDSRYEAATGMTFPSVFGMMANMYSKKYGIPMERLKHIMRLVAIERHRLGALNPKAHLNRSIRDMMNKRIAKAEQEGKPSTPWVDEEEFLEDLSVNPWVTEPLQVFDCCPFSDGASAVVLTSMDVARNLTDKPVIIAGVGQGSAGPLFTQKDITRVSAREISAKHAYDMAGLTPQDIDVCELHDCFTIAELVATEGLGFFEFGGGADAMERGDTKMGGKVVVNPSGGLKSKGHPIGATGTAQVYEIAKQLRGECGVRQVEGAKVGMTDTLGGDLSSLCTIILRRGW